MDYTFHNFIRCLLHKANTDDLRRLGYLAFLTQYDIYNLGIANIAIEYTHGGKPITRSRFYIGYDSIIQLEDLLFTEYSELTGTYYLPLTVEKRIIDTVHKYNTYKTWQLATTIKKKLKLEPREKHMDYLGKDIKHYLYIEKFKTIKKEI